jgi:hypothetical protein
MLSLDADLADWLEHLDPKAAEQVRAASRRALARFSAGELDAAGLYSLWAGDGARVLANIAEVIWSQKVEAQWRYGRRNPAAVPRAVSEVLTPLMAGRAHVSEDGVVHDGAGEQIGQVSLSAYRPEVATVDAAVLFARDLNLLGSVRGHRLIRLLTLRVHQQWLAQEDDWRVVEFSSGLKGLQEAIRCQDSSNDRLRALLGAGQFAMFAHPHVVLGGLWTWEEHRGGPGRPGCVRMTVGTALAPTLATRMKREGGSSLQAREARRLVPELQYEPPLRGVSERSQGAAWTLARRFVVHLVNKRRTLHREGTVLISEEDWLRLAHEAGLPRNLLPRVRHMWAAGESDDAPALLHEPERGHFTLADPHALEREFIRLGGKTDLDASDRARAGHHRTART